MQEQLGGAGTGILRVPDFQVEVVLENRFLRGEVVVRSPNLSKH